ncbi:MAG TPA: hypothetical protein PK776_06660 [Flavobacterium sp.]|nr:hypothetical protein [Flavobacterium sp.]
MAKTKKAPTPNDNVSRVKNSLDVTFTYDKINREKQAIAKLKK